MICGYFVSKKIKEVGAMAKWLRVLASLPEELGLIGSPTSKESDAFF